MKPTRERAAAAEFRFHAARNAVAAGKSSVFDLDEEALTFRAMEDLAIALRGGFPGQSTLEMLADFLDGISMTNAGEQTSKTVNENFRLAARVLGHPRMGGHDDHDYARQRAVALFELCRQEGLAEEQAIKMAYNVYWFHTMPFPDTPRTFEVDETKPCTVTVGAKQQVSNYAKRFVDGELRKWLRDAGSITPKRRGRKPSKPE